ncbi:uncharacterized protein LOC129615613 [Condylostylus longicornis]|uniref:uncharacterized protein LOC129615613 n=1 Tax=Condylostylus longicornis TaxID=2530218 RepID=UPI00244DF9A1|nr:uncharacterized protein LOC129615613 [Condylostylus longicornis]
MLDFRSELLTNLKLQEFQICSYVDWPKMKDFIEKQNLISNLSMCNSRYNLTENDIISIINNLPLLEVLNLERNDAFNSTAMKKVLELRHLKILNINQAYNSFNYDITPRKNFKLVQLQCDGINLNDENFCKLFENLPNLEVLHTSTTTVSNIGIQSIIKNCKKLTELHFVGSEKITKYGLNGIDPVSSEKTGNCITELKNLEVLNVRNCHITKDLPLELKFQNLKKLILTDIFLENSILDETIFECIRKNCPNVNYLSVFLKNVDTSEEIESVIERITEKLGCNIKDWIYHHLQDGFWISISNS